MQWPGSVDLMMRTFAHDVSLYPTLFDSISLFWPSAVGRIVVVISDDEPELARVVQEQYLRSMRKARRSTELLPLSVLIENVPTVLREELFFEKQYSTMIFDRYSDADYVAILDTDAILQTYVTAQSLFAADGKPWLIGSKNRGWYINSTNRILGEGGGRNNFMEQLPFVTPRALLRSMRADLVTKHSQTGNLDRALAQCRRGVGECQDDFLALFHYTYVHLKAAYSWLGERNTPCNFCIIGSWAEAFMRNASFRFVYEEDDKPLLRIAEHKFEIRSIPKIHDWAGNASRARQRAKGSAEMAAVRAVKLNEMYCKASLLQTPACERLRQGGSFQPELLRFQGRESWNRDADMCRVYRAHAWCAQAAVKSLIAANRQDQRPRYGLLEDASVGAALDDATAELGRLGWRCSAQRLSAK